MLGIDRTLDRLKRLCEKSTVTSDRFQGGLALD